MYFSLVVHRHIIIKIKLCAFETHFYILDSMVIEQAVKMQGVY